MNLLMFSLSLLRIIDLK